MLTRVKYILLLTLSGFVASCQTNIEGNYNAESSLADTIVETVVDTTDQLIDTTYYNYSWKEHYNHKKALINNIKLPNGYFRKKTITSSFAGWLQHLPLSDENTVYLYNGEKKYYQGAQFKVIDIDVGDRDLQQCADAVMRLRAEFLYASQKFNKIQFNYTNGTTISFSKWSSGFCPTLRGNNVTWTTSANNKSYKSFKKYLVNIFMYAGTASLEKEMKSVPLSEIKAGDVFIKGGFPGHAVIVLDVAEHKINKDKVFLLAQSYMPAQNVHILKNLNNAEFSPWYSLSQIEDVIETPEWTFTKDQLKRFVE